MRRLLLLGSRGACVQVVTQRRCKCAGHGSALHVSICSVNPLYANLVVYIPLSQVVCKAPDLQLCGCDFQSSGGIPMGLVKHLRPLTTHYWPRFIYLFLILIMRSTIIPRAAFLAYCSDSAAMLWFQGPTNDWHRLSGSQCHIIHPSTIMKMVPREWSFQASRCLRKSLLYTSLLPFPIDPRRSTLTKYVRSCFLY